MIGRPRRRVYDWNEKDYPELYGMSLEQVAAMGGKFYSPSGSWVYPTETNTCWFVPTSGTLPVMTKTKGIGRLWFPRGF